MSFLDRYFSSDESEAAVQERDRLVARLDRAIPDLTKEARGYLAIGREILRRIQLA